VLPFQFGRGLIPPTARHVALDRPASAQQRAAPPVQAGPTAIVDRPLASRPVIDAVAYSVVGLGLVLAGWTGWSVYRRRPTGEVQMVVAIVLEAALLAQSVIGIARVSGAGVVEPATFVAYAAGILLPVPLGFQLARMERTRWGSLCLCFTSIVTSVMTLRLLQLWHEHG
jgi:hypothetical protein